MKYMLLLALLFSLPITIAEDCATAYSGMWITQDTALCNQAADLADGILIKTSNVTLDCNGAIIRGTGLQQGQGILLENVEGVTVKNCNILNYNTGILLKNSNRNEITQNGLLKNNIGIRLISSFENFFESNKDKSVLKAVSAIASRFNNFYLINRDIEMDFCQENVCNKAEPMNPCQNDDAYCSPFCTHENDNDCAKPFIAEELQPITEYPALPNETPAIIPAPILQNTTPAVHTTESKKAISLLEGFSEKKKFWIIAGLAILTYIVGFLAFQHHYWKHG
jgi:parallel beta-helix repeat protein